MLFYSKIYNGKIEGKGKKTSIVVPYYLQEVPFLEPPENWKITYIKTRCFPGPLHPPPQPEQSSSQAQRYAEACSGHVWLPALLRVSENPAGLSGPLLLSGLGEVAQHPWAMKITNAEMDNMGAL